MKNIRHSIFALSLFLLLSLVVIATPAQAATSQIFDGSIDEKSLSMSDGKIIWSSSNGEQLYIYHLSSGIAQLASNTVPMYYTSIRDGRVVGKCRNNYDPNYSICIYDIVSGTTTEIDSLSTTISPPHVEGNKVVWINFDDQNKLYIYDILAQTTTLAANNAYGGSPHNDFPQINEGKIFFNIQDSETLSSGMALYDIFTGNTTQISEIGGSYPNSVQQIQDGKVVWSANDPVTNVAQIYMYDIATASTTQITHSSYYSIFPRLHNGKIAWIGGGEESISVYVYDMASQTTSQIANHSIYDITPNENMRLVLGENKVFWSFVRGGTFVYDMATQTTTQLSGGSEYYSDSQIVHENGSTAWQHCDENNQNCEVLLWDHNSPDVSAIMAPDVPVQKNTSINTSATFTNPNTANTHTAVWDWGDGTTSTCPANTTACTLTATNGAGTITGSHAYTTAGTYTITLTVTDNTGAQGVSTYQFISVYDNQTDSVSGSTRFVTPAGAVTENPNASGNTDFGFTAKYDANGNVVPDRNDWAQLLFDQGNTHVEFLATQYQSLTISTGTAILKGTGNYNNQPGYKVLIAAKEQQGGKGFIRYQIKDASNNVVYDTQPGAADNAEPTTPVSKGKIKIN